MYTPPYTRYASRNRRAFRCVVAHPIGPLPRILVRDTAGTGSADDTRGPTMSQYGSPPDPNQPDPTPARRRTSRPVQPAARRPARPVRRSRRREPLRPRRSARTASRAPQQPAPAPPEPVRRQPIAPAPEPVRRPSSRRGPGLRVRRLRVAGSRGSSRYLIDGLPRLPRRGSRSGSATSCSSPTPPPTTDAHGVQQVHFHSAAGSTVLILIGVDHVAGVLRLELVHPPGPHRRDRRQERAGDPRGPRRHAADRRRPGVPALPAATSSTPSPATSATSGRSGTTRSRPSPTRS